MKIEAVDFFYLSMPQVTTRPTAARMPCSCASRPAAMSAGANARRRRCPRSPPSSARCRTASAGRSAPRSSARRSKGRTTSPRMSAARRLRQHGPAAGRPHLVGRRDGAVGPAGQARAASRCGSCSGYARSHPEDALCLGALRRHAAGRRWSTRKRDPRATGFRGGEVRLGPDRPRQRRRTTPTSSMAAREGLGPDGMLLVDVGQIFGRGRGAAAERLPALEAAGATWLEEPFQRQRLCEPMPRSPRAVRTVQARRRRGRAQRRTWPRHLIDYGGVGFIQIDCGRIGGIGPAKQVADYAAARGVTYVNHTFTSHLALSRLAAALRRARRSPHLRVPDGHQARRAGLHAQPPRARRQRRGARAGGARARHRDRAGGGAAISPRCRDQGCREGPLPLADDWLKPGAARSCGAELRLWHPGSFGHGKCLLCRSQRCCGGRESRVCRQRVTQGPPAPHEDAKLRRRRTRTRGRTLPLPAPPRSRS